MARLVARHYTPGRYRGRAVLLPTRKAAENRSGDWSRFVAGGLEVCEMPGGHLDAIQGRI